MASETGNEQPKPDDVLALIIGYEKEADSLDLETAALEKEAETLLSQFQLEDLEDECRKLEAAADTLEMAAAMAAMAIEAESEEESDYDVATPRRIVVSPRKNSRNPRPKVTFRIPRLIAPPVADKRTLILRKSKQKLDERNRWDTHETDPSDDEPKMKKPARFSRARSATPRIESTEQSPAVSRRRKHRCEMKSWEEEAEKEDLFPVSSIRVGRKWRQKRWARLQRMWRRRERRWRKHRQEGLQAVTTVITLIDASGTTGCSNTNDSTNATLVSPSTRQNT